MRYISIVSGSIVAAVISIYFSLRYTRALGITGISVFHVMNKSMNLSVCYDGLNPVFGFSRAYKAAICGFISATYDFATDKCDYSRRARSRFFSLLGKFVRNEPFLAVEDMYVADRENSLQRDGLERGAISLAVILDTLGVRGFNEMTGETTILGDKLQMLDDILDYEADKEAGDHNFLLCNNKDRYIAEYVAFDWKVALVHYPRATVILYLIRKSQRKLEMPHLGYADLATAAIHTDAIRQEQQDVATRMLNEN